MEPSNHGKQQIDSTPETSDVVKIWLIIGLFMILFQIVLGGITRLTGSGLSITKWEIVVGVVPPLNDTQWEDAFNLYKATPQYKLINKGMTMSEFKFIFFWEYIHRLWGRLMGMVFLIPFLVFWRKGWFSKSLFKDLIVVFILAALVASFGWIMVASGLINKPWVNAYKLTLHFSFAVLCFSYLLWTTFKIIHPAKKVIHIPVLKKLGILLTFVVCFQLVIGGIMAGIKAGPYYPSWPDMNKEIIPSILFENSSWSVKNFVDYEQSSFLPAFIQTLHRFIAYLLFILTLCYFFVGFFRSKNVHFRNAIFVLITLVTIQIILGILTVINSLGSPPLVLGVVHQTCALLLLSICLFLNYLLLERTF